MAIRAYGGCDRVVFTGGGLCVRRGEAHTSSHGRSAHASPETERKRRKTNTRGMTEGSEREGVLHYPLRQGEGVEGWDQSFCMRRR